MAKNHLHPEEGRKLSRRGVLPHTPAVKSGTSQSIQFIFMIFPPRHKMLSFLVDTGLSNGKTEIICLCLILQSFQAKWQPSFPTAYKQAKISYSFAVIASSLRRTYPSPSREIHHDLTIVLMTCLLYLSAWLYLPVFSKPPSAKQVKMCALNYTQRHGTVLRSPEDIF